MTLGAVTELYYDRARDYSPSLGRWLTRDPIGYQGGINLYGFVNSSPVGNVDGTGPPGGTIAAVANANGTATNVGYYFGKVTDSATAKLGNGSTMTGEATVKAKAKVTQNLKPSSIQIGAKCMVHGLPHLLLPGKSAVCS